MKKKLWSGSAAVLLGLQLMSPLAVFANNEGELDMNVGHYTLRYYFDNGHVGRPHVEIIEGDNEPVGHLYGIGTTGAPMSFYINGSDKEMTPFAAQSFKLNPGWSHTSTDNTSTELRSTFEFPRQAVVTARLAPYEGVGVLHEYTYTNKSGSPIEIEGMRMADTYLETDQVPIYSLGPKQGLYIKGDKYRLDYLMGIDHGPDKYTGIAWRTEVRQDVYNRLKAADDHSNEPKDKSVLAFSDTAIGMVWDSQTLGPGETATFTYVVKISGNIDANASFSTLGNKDPQPNEPIYLDTSAFGDSEFTGVKNGTFEFDLPTGVRLALGRNVQVLDSQGRTVREIESRRVDRGRRVEIFLGSSDVSDNGFRVRVPLVADNSWGNKTLGINVNASLTGDTGMRSSTTDARTRIVNVVETETDVKYESIPVETETRENINLTRGETRVIQEGKPGREKITYEVTTTNGVETNRREVGREVAEPMVKRIVEVGAMVTEVKEEAREEAIPFQEQVVENPELFEGEERITQEGVPGVLEIIDEVTYENGQEVSRRKVSESVKVEPIPEILEVGTLVEERREEVTQETIPFEVQTVENPDMHLGSSRVVQAGVNGVLDIVEEVVYHNGHEVARTEVDRVVSKEPVTQIVEEGSLIEEIVEEIVEEPIAFETEMVDNILMEQGESRVVQEGQDGLNQLFYSVTYHNGEEVDRVLIKEEVAQEPITEIIEEGALVREILTEEKEEAIGSKDEIRETKELPEGEKRVVQEGQAGVLKITEEVVIENDVEVSRREIDREVLQEAIDQITEVGTGVFGTLEEVDEEEIPYETEYVETDELAKDEERVVQEGVVGIKTITSVYETFNDEKIGEPEVTEEVTEEPVNEIIEVGTGIVGSKEEVEEVELPYDTERVENKELEEGQEKVIQEGVLGVKTITSVFETLDDEIVGDPEVTEEVTKEPVNEIIEVGVGVKDVDEETQDVAIPFNTKRVENPNLPEGETHLAQKGEVGVKRITTKQATFNEEAVGEPEVTEEILKEPVDEIIEVGTYRRPAQGKVMPQPVIKQDLPSTGEVLGTTGILAGLGSLVAGLGAWVTKRKRK